MRINVDRTKGIYKNQGMMVGTSRSFGHLGQIGKVEFFVIGRF